MNFAPVATLEELDALNPAEILEGYTAAERGDPEPGENRGKAYWHGWCNRQRDYGALPQTAETKLLVKAYMARRRVEQATQQGRN